MGPGEGEMLPNKLGLTDIEKINEEELVGFTQAEHDAIDALQPDTIFTLEYLYDLHQKALGHLYDFAGRLRTVDMSKDGFAFPAATFLPANIGTFEQKYLQPLKEPWTDNDSLQKYAAALHAELLYLHPFREGNGRVIRLFTKLILLAKTGREVHFDRINQGDNFNRYVAAVQQAAEGRYDLMEDLFTEMQA